MNLDLTDRVAIVTGGSMGIGKAVARQLIDEGCHVAITSRRMEPLEAAAAELNAPSSQARVVPFTTDTSSTDRVREMVAAVVAEFGRIDILVNGAAAPAGLVRNEVTEADPELLLADINTKVIGYFRCAQAVVPHMRERSFGRIVNIGGLTGRSSHAISGLRNLGVVHLTKSLSDQLGPDGITVNTLHPGVVDTEHIHELYEKEAAKQGTTPAAVEQGYIDRTPIRRVLTAQEIGDAVCFLASPLAGAITGESIGIDGGLSRGIFI